MVKEFEGGQACGAQLDMAVQIGANPAIAAHAGKFMGIRNGIDLDIWDPENDSLLPLPYSASNVVEVSYDTPCLPQDGSVPFELSWVLPYMR